MLYKLSLLLLLVVSLKIKFLDGQPEGYTPWTHPETPEELRAKAIALRVQLDTYGAKDFQEPCDPDIEPYKSYAFLGEALNGDEWSPNEAEADAVYKFFDKTGPAAEAWKILQDKLKELKKSGTKQRIFCPVTKGMICNPLFGIKQCICKQHYDYHPKVGSDVTEDKNLARFSPDEGKCIFKENSECLIRDAGWEPVCEKNTECFISSEKKDTGNGFVSVPIENDPCTLRNREKWDLPNDWTCHCRRNRASTLKILQKLDQDIKNPVFWGIKYNEKCDRDFQVSLITLGEVLETSNPHRSQDEMEFYGFAHGSQYAKLNKEVSTYKDILEHPEWNYTFTRIFCGGHATNKMTCSRSNNLTCQCLKGGRMDNVTEVCNVPTGGYCKTDNDPHPCRQPGERCLTNLTIYGKPRVLCTDTLLNEKRTYLRLSRRDSIECECSGEKEYVNKMNQRQVDIMIKLNNDELAKRVTDFMNNTNNKTVWKILNKGDPCNWLVDRAYFRVVDFINAGLTHIPAQYNLIKTLKGFGKNKKPIAVCDLNQSLRCHFINKTCECPVDGWFSEDIHTSWNTSQSKCELEKNSLCHPTIEEYIKCPGTQKCMYKEIPVRCDRATRQKIIDHGVILNSARCTCSDTQPEDFAKYKSYRRKNKAKKTKVEF